MNNTKKFRLYTINPEKEDRIWKECIFIFDASALLDLYYYTCDEVNSIFENIFYNLKKRLWIPDQFLYEYLKNREKVIVKPIKKYNNLINQDSNNKDSGNVQEIERNIKNISEAISKIDERYKDFKNKSKRTGRHPFLEPDLVDKFTSPYVKFKDSFKEFEDALGDFKNQIKHEIYKIEKKINSTVEKDSLLLKIKDSFETGDPYSYNIIMEIVREGAFRYSQGIPPGYKDNDKEGFQAYGDLIAWKQIIDHAKKVKKPIVIVLNDTKIDWCSKDYKNKKIDKPREELIKEIYDEAGVELWMYTFKDFLYQANKSQGDKLDKKIIGKAEKLGQLKEELSETNKLYNTSAIAKQLSEINKSYNTPAVAKYLSEINKSYNTPAIAKYLSEINKLYNTPAIVKQLSEINKYKKNLQMGNDEKDD